MLLALGVLIRVALYFPLAAFQIDSDAVLSGLCAFRVADGHYPMFFPGGTRLSAASCYVAAGFFHLLGPGRVGLALTALSWATLYLAFSLLFLRAMLGIKEACLAFVFAIVPPEQFMTVTYAPWAYGEIIASCAATLWLAARWRSTGKPWQRVLWGFSAGLGIWFSLETLMIGLPAVVWIAIRRGRLMLREAPLAILGFVAGSMPFLLWNAAHGFTSLTRNWASRPVSSVAQAWSNFVWLSAYMLPKLLFRSSGWWSETTLLVAAFTLVAIGFAVAIWQNQKPRDRPYTARDIGTLLLLSLAACALIFSFSQAGASRGWTVRYIAPLYVVMPLFFAIGAQVLWSWSKVLSTVTVAALLVPNLLLYGLPGSSLRARLTSELANDKEIRRVLERDRIQMVYGDYFWVYHLNFDSRERIAGIPSSPVVDYYHYADRLGASPVRWALLGGLDEDNRLVRAVGARGSLIRDGDLWLFVSDRSAPNATALIAALRSAGS